MLPDIQPEKYPANPDSSGDGAEEVGENGEWQREYGSIR
jgi:hypothetical protein